MPIAWVLSSALLLTVWCLGEGGLREAVHRRYVHMQIRTPPRVYHVYHLPVLDTRARVRACLPARAQTTTV